MMTLPSPGGSRTSRLRSPKSLLANSSSHEVSSVGGVRRPPVGTPTVTVIQKVPTVALEHRSTMGFPP
jgi:hypothetical protein